MPVLIEISLSSVIFCRQYFSTTWSTLSLRRGNEQRCSCCRTNENLNVSKTGNDTLTHTPLDGEVVITLGLRGDVLPQLAGRQAGPRRVVAAAGDPVAALAAFASRHQLVGGQVGHRVGEGAQEAVQEMAHCSRQRRQLDSLCGQRGKNTEHYIFTTLISLRS